MRAALAVSRGMGLPLKRGLVVLPSDGRLPATEGHPLGQFDPKTSQIRVLPYAVALDNWRESHAGFGVAFSRAMWRGFVAHEAAHAVADQYFAAGIERQSASEYIAAVVQLSSLPQATREEILARHAGIAGWNSVVEITLTYYLLDPARFAVKSYRHYLALAPDERRLFVERMLQKGLSDS